MRDLFKVLLLLFCIGHLGCKSSKEPSTAVTPTSADDSYTHCWHNELLIVKVGGKYGFIDRNGKVVVNPQFDEVNAFRNGAAEICLGKCSWDGQQA
jgi:hypothetical protein